MGRADIAVAAPGYIVLGFALGRERAFIPPSRIILLSPTVAHGLPCREDQTQVNVGQWTAVLVNHLCSPLFSDIEMNSASAWL